MGKKEHAEKEGKERQTKTLQEKIRTAMSEQATKRAKTIEHDAKLKTKLDGLDNGYPTAERQIKKILERDQKERDAKKRREQRGKLAWHEQEKKQKERTTKEAQSKLDRNEKLIKERRVKNECACRKQVKDTEKNFCEERKKKAQEAERKSKEALMKCEKTTKAQERKIKAAERMYKMLAKAMEKKHKNLMKCRERVIKYKPPTPAPVEDDYYCGPPAPPGAQLKKPINFWGPQEAS